MSDSSREANRLLRSGRVEEAEQVFMQILAADPFNLEALNFVGLAALQMGQLHRARELLERAVSVSPKHAASQHHLGRAAELLGDLPAARSAYETAVRLSTTLPAARLHLAALLEQQGEHHASLVQYARVMNDMQSQGKWVNPATTPPALVSLVAHAAQVVREGRRAVYYGFLAPLVAEYGRGELARVERMLRVHLGDESPDRPDPRQQPTFLHLPGLPATPYFERELFPWIDAVEEATPVIRAELEALLPAQTGAENVFSTPELAAQNLKGTQVAPSWTGHYFWRHGERRDANCAACPATSAILDALPLSRVRDHGPEVLFSVFTPGTHLLPHRGVTNTRIVAHLPLIVPTDCALVVGGEVHEWRAGRIVAFDDTYEHEAWNRSDQIRVVLIFDLWNPHLTEPERVAVARIVEGIGDFRRAQAEA